MTGGFDVEVGRNEQQGVRPLWRRFLITGGTSRMPYLLFRGRYRYRFSIISYLICICGSYMTWASWIIVKMVWHWGCWREKTTIYNLRNFDWCYQSIQNLSFHIIWCYAICTSSNGQIVPCFAEDRIFWESYGTTMTADAVRIDTCRCSN